MHKTCRCLCCPALPTVPSVQHIRHSATKALLLCAPAPARLSPPASIRLYASACLPHALLQSSCSATPTCVWCVSAAVPSACYSEAEAKRLPAAVFRCKFPSSLA